MKKGRQVYKQKLRAPFYILLNEVVLFLILPHFIQSSTPSPIRQPLSPKMLAMTSGFTPAMEQQLIEEVKYLHHLWWQGPPPRPSQTNHPRLHRSPALIGSAIRCHQTIPLQPHGTQSRPLPGPPLPTLLLAMSSHGCSPPRHRRRQSSFAGITSRTSGNTTATPMRTWKRISSSSSRGCWRKMLGPMGFRKDLQGVTCLS